MGFLGKLFGKKKTAVPRDFGGEGQPSLCVILDEYKPNGIPFTIGDRTHGLLLVIEVFRDEMEYAMAMGSQTIIDKLKAKVHYPYSDLNRDSVLKFKK